MTQSNGNSILTALSDSVAAEGGRGATARVRSAGRRTLPASGIAYASDLILTADHVIERDDDIPVVLPDGTELMARLAGRDPGSDLAVLRLGSAGAAVADPAPPEA